MTNNPERNKNLSKYPKLSDIDLEKAFLKNHILECQSKIDKLNEVRETIIGIEKSKLPLWDPSKIVWIKASGPKGDFELATVTNNPNSENFELLQEDLKVHDGKITYQGFFYWLHFDKESVCRKQRGQD